MATDAICEKLDDTAAEEVETLLPLFKDHLPKTISDLAFDEVHNRVPYQYICNAIASCLASKLVYKEGCDFIEQLPKEKLASYAMKYIEKEREIAILKDAIDSTNMSEHERSAIIQILDSGGVRTALNLNLRLSNEKVEG